jgi:hypothetical protein
VFVNITDRLRPLFILLAAAILFGCAEPHTQKKKYNQTNSEVVPLAQTQQVATTITIAEPTRMPDPVVDYNFIPDPRYTAWPGVRIAQAKWKDLRGLNIIILSIQHQYYWTEKKPELKKYMANEDETEAAELHAVHYILKPDSASWQKYWEYNDVKLSCCDVSFNYLPGTLKVTDIDSNSVLESVFSFHTTEGTQAIDFSYPGKLIYHLDSTLYTVSGTIGLMRTHYNYEHIRFSPNYNKLGNLYKEYLAKQWEYGVALRDSMDNSLKKLWE